MTIQIVSDSGCDIPEQLLKNLNIKIVPFLIQWGDISLRDGVDITPGRIYELLKEGINLKTAAPAPGDFVKIYRESGDEIVSIHISRKISATYESALIAKAIVEEEKGCKIKVIDSEAVVMGVGFLVILAAKMISTGKGLNDIVSEINNTIPKIHMFGIVDNPKYILRSGRIKLPNVPLFSNLAKKADSSIPLKLVLTMRDGKISPFHIPVRKEHIEEKFISFLNRFPLIESIAVEYANSEDEERVFYLYDRIKSLFRGRHFTFQGLVQRWESTGARGL